MSYVFMFLSHFTVPVKWLHMLFTFFMFNKQSSVMFCSAPVWKVTFYTSPTVIRAEVHTSS